MRNIESARVAQPRLLGRPALELDLSAQRTRAIERDALYGLRNILEAEGLG